MKPIKVNAVFFAKDKVLFPIGRDFMHYQIQYTPKTSEAGAEDAAASESKTSKKRAPKEK